MKKVFEGLNAEHMLDPPRPRRKLTKYIDKDKHYTVVEGEDVVHVDFTDCRVCEQGEVISFMNRSTISKVEFDKMTS